VSEEHVPEIVELWKELSDHHSNIDSFFTRRRNAHLNFTSFLAELILSNEAKVFIAVKNAEVLGYIITKVEKYPPIYMLKTYGTIYDILVTSKYRRKGIGTKLLEEALEWFKSLGLERIELSIVPANIESSSFWKKHGFQEYMHKLFKKIK
jgi:ribosomal protein S18 acetylase RimI-like enzyme